MRACVRMCVGSEVSGVTQIIEVSNSCQGKCDRIGYRQVEGCHRAGDGQHIHRPLQRLVLRFGGSWHVCAFFSGVLGTSSVVGMEKGD